MLIICCIFTVALYRINKKKQTRFALQRSGREGQADDASFTVMQPFTTLPCHYYCGFDMIRQKKLLSRLGRRKRRACLFLIVSSHHPQLKITIAPTSSLKNMKFAISTFLYFSAIMIINFFIILRTCHTLVNHVSRPTLTQEQTSKLHHFSTEWIFTASKRFMHMLVVWYLGVGCTCSYFKYHLQYGAVSTW